MATCPLFGSVAAGCPHIERLGVAGLRLPSGAVEGLLACCAGLSRARITVS
jgi:hypothetical protein